ncbi:homoserine kinase [Thermogladius sp. 4427co]|uniref:homoserine kinase n=1 Tax=Thermogladius sp. 4427co TaxID=3450718 RepID=UPI003F7A9742
MPNFIKYQILTGGWGGVEANAPYACNSRIVVKAPASIANLGPGFDVVSVAIGKIFDTVEVELSKGVGEIRVDAEGRVPSGSENVAYVVARLALDMLPILKQCNIVIRVKKGVPVGAGLGSSGSTAAAVSYALSYLAGSVDDRLLLKLAAEGERFVAGDVHYDNVAASLFGGLVVVDVENVNCYRIEFSRDVHVGVVTPFMVNGILDRKKTAYARKLLPETIDLKTHVKQSSLLAQLIYAAVKGDIRLLGRLVSKDYVVEPYRSKLIPYYFEMKELALREGAYGFNIAGAGPSVFFIHESQDEVLRIGGVLKDFLKTRGIESTFIQTFFSNTGVEVISFETI